MCSDRLSIDQRVAVLSFEHAKVNDRWLTSQVFFVPSSFCHSCMSRITSWTSIWMQFPKMFPEQKYNYSSFFEYDFIFRFLFRKCRVLCIFSIFGLLNYVRTWWVSPCWVKLSRRLHSWWCPSINSFRFQLCNHSSLGTQTRWFLMEVP